MKYKYNVGLNFKGERIWFTFDDYDDVQNLIGYMVAGARTVDITIFKEAINE